MKKSISFKLFIWMICLGIFFICLSWVFNTRFLEGYYISQKRQFLLESAQKINSIYKGDAELIQLELKEAESRLGGYVFILSRDDRVKYSSFFDAGGPQKLPRVMPFSFLRHRRSLDVPYEFRIAKEPDSDSAFLTLNYILADYDQLIFVVPLAAVAQTLAIVNRFFFFTGIVVIVFGLMVAYFFSRKFTRPLLEINQAARHMADLDFSRKCTVKSQDEVGELGKSINFLSEQLERSINELHEKNQKLQADIERKRQIDEMRKEFISNVSHELKTPIALIQGYAEGLKVNVNEDEENKNFYCEVIIDETGRMDKIVKDLLNLSQMEAGCQLERNIFDLPALADRVLDKYQQVFREKEIVLELKKEKFLFVDGDVNRIEQVLVNFLNNALQHVDQKRRISVTVGKNAGKARLVVFNSGNHIPVECLDKIWTSFFKADKARTRSNGGTGLGLSIVRGIMERHGNNYGVKNVPDGVAFWIELDYVQENLHQMDT